MNLEGTNELTTEITKGPKFLTTHIHICALFILLLASHPPFLSGGLWEQGGKRPVSGCPSAGAQTPPRPSHSVTRHRSTVPHGLVPQTQCPSIGLTFRRQLDSRIRSLPSGLPPALSLPFSHPQVLAPGGQSQFKQNFLRKVILQHKPSQRKQP